ncbi:PPK2 family polyphosphate kinase [Rubrivirga sp.]|uniref:PPK2 family polyphosphate kinase n=1 Tax=Rubrivirga sp. TaxID=1885344 RepID=UPI003B52C95E
MSGPDPAALRFGPDDRLDDRDPAATDAFAGEDQARDFTEDSARRLARAQLMLEAHGTHGLLIVVEGMDAAGKDEAIHHVMGAVDPGSARARSFASMSDDEARHVFLRRAAIAAPARGELAIFNRSHYSQVVGDRVSPELLDDQSLPPEVEAGAESGALWDDRFRQIRDFERTLVENGVAVVKLFFHVSKDEQRRRLLERIERPEKRWDFGKADIEKREQWDAFLDAYGAALRATTTDRAPWFVIPSDQKWYSRAAAASVVLGALHGLHDDFPEPDDDQRELLEWGRQQLESDDS